MSGLCPSCLASVDVERVCARCGAGVVVDPDHTAVRLTELVKGDRGHDGVDGVGVLVHGVARDGQRVVVRLAAEGDAQRTRLLREATIARGLVHAQVAQVRATTPVATVFAAPRGVTVDEALAGGLRVDGRSLRRFLTSVLTVLADLERLSPPVHVLGLHAGNVFVDQDLSVALVDFSRATDTRNDDVAVGAARPGTTPPTGKHGPVDVDLYATGILAVQLASRMAPADLPKKNGRVDVARAVAVDGPLVSFLQRLLTPGTFATKREALQALNDKPSSSNAGVVAAVATALGLFGMLSLGGAAWLLVARQPPRPPDVVVVAPPVEPPVEPFVPPPVPPVPPVPPTKPPPKPPTLAPPETPPETPPAPSVDDALLRAIEVAVRAQRDEILACPDDGMDRVKLHLRLVKGHGEVKPLARGDVDGVRCVADSVAVSTWPVTPHQQVDADIWVWRKPSFKVAAY